MEKCGNYKELIHSYLDSELASKVKRQLKKHLLGCPACQKEMEMFRGLKIVLKEKISFVSVPLSLRERINNNNRKNKLPLFRIDFSFSRWVSVLASIVIILGGFYFYRQYIIKSHFLILQADTKLQKHIDTCSDCKDGSVKVIIDHVQIAALKKSGLQKHLNNCPDCHKNIVKMITHCISSMAMSIPDGSMENCLAGFVIAVDNYIV